MSYYYYYDISVGLLYIGLGHLYLLKDCSNIVGIFSNGLILRSQFAIDCSGKKIELICESGLMGLFLSLGCKRGRLKVLIVGLKFEIRARVKFLL